MGRLIDMNVSPRPVGYGTTKEAKILNELISTLPTSPEVTGLIHGTTPDELDENKDITTAITTTNPTDKLQEAVKKSKQVNCRGENKSYWELTGSSVPHGDCQEKTLIAMADYTVMSDVNRNLFFLKGSKST